MKFLHGGAIGDLIYHLPVIRALGGGELCLHAAGGMPGYEHLHEMFWTSLHRLLQAQPYLTKVEWTEDPSIIQDGRICIDHFRYRLDYTKNLTNMVAQWLGMPLIPDNCPPWIEVDGQIVVAKVLINRTPRHNFHGFPWQRIVDHYRKDACFIGLKDEHTDFVKNFGHIPYYHTPDLWEAARAIKGCQFYIGTGSGLTALCEGLKHRCIVGSAPEYSHAIFFDRPGQQHCWDKVDLWDVT